MITIDEFENFIQHDLVYEQKLISVLDDLGRQIYIEGLGQLHSNYGKTVKVECMEKYNSQIYDTCCELQYVYKHDGPVTCHAFRAYENSASFGTHTDPDDVYIHVVWGEKTLQIIDEVNTFTSGESVFIPSNTPHKAINKKESLILSFGLEKFLVNKL